MCTLLDTHTFGKRKEQKMISMLEYLKAKLFETENNNDNKTQNHGREKEQHRELVPNV
jgi:hypothetical protein